MKKIILNLGRAMAEELLKTKVTKAEAPRLFFKSVLGEWQTVTEAQATKLVHALDHNVRRTILGLLDAHGSVRKFKITELVNLELKTNYDDSTIQHHLELLEEAGLITSVPGKSKRSKIIYRAADVQVQLRKRTMPGIPLQEALEDE